MDTPEPASATPAPSSSDAATESAWERGLRHAKEVLLCEASLLFVSKYEPSLFLIYVRLPVLIEFSCWPLGFISPAVYLMLSLLRFMTLLNDNSCFILLIFYLAHVYSYKCKAGFSVHCFWRMFNVSSVLCWFPDRKGIWPVKNIAQQFSWRSLEDISGKPVKWLLRWLCVLKELCWLAFPFLKPLCLKFCIQQQYHEYDNVW